MQVTKEYLKAVERKLKRRGMDDEDIRKELMKIQGIEEEKPISKKKKDDVRLDSDQTDA